MTKQRLLGAANLRINECADGTICENSSPCVPHPAKEGSYMCDCYSARDENQNSLVKFAGVYCEHKATSYCQSGDPYSEHAFCTNGGECKRLVTRTDEHAGCKCPGGYEGDYCQFVEGGRPSDWELSNYMHPSLSSVYGSNQSNAGSVVLAIMIGSLVCFVMICAFAVGYVYLPSLKDKFNHNEKEMDTGATEESLGGRRSSMAERFTISPANSSFLGGKSVYKKKESSTTFVTGDTMDADGGVLTEALGGTKPGATMEETQGLDGGEQGLEDVDVDKATSMEEVNLDDEPASKLGPMV